MERSLPVNYIELDQEEMLYLDGGCTWWQYALVYSAMTLAGVGLEVAIAYGQIWTVASLMKATFAAAVKSLGAKGVTTIVAGSFSISLTLIYKAISRIS